MRKRQAVQQLPVLGLLGHVGVQQGFETIVVMALQQMAQFMSQDVFQARGGFLRQF